MKTKLDELIANFYERMEQLKKAHPQGQPEPYINGLYSGIKEALDKTLELRNEQRGKMKNEVYRVMTKSFDDWEIDGFHATYKPMKITYWIGNSLFFFKNEGSFSVSIGFFNWLKLWFWIQKCKRMKVISEYERRQREQR
jgi:hypothetical protein